MALDWVVIAKEENGEEINPNDILGVKRASRDDDEVMSKLRDIWSKNYQDRNFDDWLDEQISQEFPPVVISYGKGFEEAIPIVRAEVQYYGYRGAVLRSDFNSLCSLAESNGIDVSWLYDDINTVEDFRYRIEALNKIIHLAKKRYPLAMEFAESYMEYVSAQDDKKCGIIQRQAEEDADVAEIFEHAIYILGAIKWLTFWSDKNFTVAADY